MEAGLPAIFVVAGKVPTQNLLFVEQAKDEDRGDEHVDGQRPVRAERKGQEEKHRQHAEIHRMAHDAIGPGGYEVLAGLDLNRARGVAIDDRDR